MNVGIKNLIKGFVAHGFVSMELELNIAQIIFLEIHLCFRIKINAYRIDAIPLTCGFFRAVVKNMTQMAAAIGADRFGTNHAVTGVANIFNGTFNGLIKRWPPATTFKFMLALEQFSIACFAVVVAVFKMKIELARIGSFGPLLAQYIVFLGGKFLFPLFLGFVHTVFFIHKLLVSIYLLSGIKSRATPLMQCLLPVVLRGPSLKTWPKCPPQTAQCSSVRATPIL
mmetsp:Transcript_13131/g.28248  ORF Transcript_13131/g.28248 Transcript_13131/m.28248 type:complete len:226 (-) Transcript_13131:366-1043(-)